MSKKIRPIETHFAAIKSGTVDKTVVIGLRKALNTFSRISAGYSVSKTSPKITDEEVNQIADLLAEHRPRVVGELHESGLALLQGKRYRKQLASVADIIAELDHFALVGFEEIFAHHGRLSFHFPVYRARGKSGRSFPFYVVPWQSGGNGPELANPNYY